MTPLSAMEVYFMVSICFASRGRRNRPLAVSDTCSGSHNAFAIGRGSIFSSERCLGIDEIALCDVTQFAATDRRTFSSIEV